jgi:hypothetical protein
MTTLQGILRLLGTHGAVANARGELERPRRDAAAVDVLVRHLDAAPGRRAAEAA